MKWVIVPVGHLASLAKTVGIYRDEMAEYSTFVCNHEITAWLFSCCCSRTFDRCRTFDAVVSWILREEPKTHLPCNFFDELRWIGCIKFHTKIQIVSVIGSFQLPGYSGRLIQPMLYIDEIVHVIYKTGKLLFVMVILRNIVH